MFPKTNRLRKKRDVKRVFKKGQRVHNSLLQLFFLKNFCNKVRVTVVVGKKYDKKAVYRNKLKRLVREWLHYDILSLSGIDLIIMPSKKFATKKPDIVKLIKFIT